ncbi:uncharacterized protein LOC122555686 isoform X1 [Chiloscyllium plagiosum]|uniref:uncharacterized protein LOC122555686 isoform X1 n=1 Tax=Chiloscyllium plagiosum TaxID=36176 RepID=UPI001CB84E64|nr:uncharacterized protein LOC122555686 isoform X1 [Chiloscyllium plagiosum]
MGLSVRALSRPAVYCSANKAPVRSTSASLFCDLFSCSTFLQRLGDHRFGYFILHSIDEAVPQVCLIRCDFCCLYVFRWSQSTMDIMGFSEARKVLGHSLTFSLFTHCYFDHVHSHWECLPMGGRQRGNKSINASVLFCLQVSCSDMDVYGWPVTLLLASLLRSVADSQSCHAKGPFQRWRLSERPSRGWRLHLLGILRIPPSHRVLEQAPRFTVVEIKWTPLNY